MHRPIIYLTPTLQHDFLTRRERVEAFTPEPHMGRTAILILVLGVILTFVAMVVAA
jgi:hypothetical protein